MLGNFKNGNPFIEIEVSGKSSKKLEALIDTGFNGYLTLPFSEAFPLGLILVGIQTSKLADGSLSHHFVCLGKVKIEDKEIETTVDIQPLCTILLGTKLLKELSKTAQIDFVNEKIEINDTVLINQSLKP